MVAQLYFALHDINVGVMASFTLITNDFILAMKIIAKATLRIQSFTLKLHYRNLQFVSKFNWSVFYIRSFCSHLVIQSFAAYLTV